MIVVKGVREFTSKVSIFIARFPVNVLQEASREAAELTVRVARPEVPVQTGRASRSLQAVTTGTTASAEGGQDVEYYAYLEYGGTSGRAHATQREIVANGRYIQPAYEENKFEIHAQAEEKLRSALSRAGFERR